jgi:protein-S-isoprenylcysteine O-methyltransferase Ste14
VGTRPQNKGVAVEEEPGNGAPIPAEKVVLAVVTCVVTHVVTSQQCHNDVTTLTAALAVVTLIEVVLAVVACVVTRVVTSQLMLQQYHDASSGASRCGMI